MKPLLTIAILCKNASNTIVQTLESAKFADEILLLDDNSSDDSLDKITHSGVNVQVLSNKKGFDNFSAKRNYLMEHANGIWIFYLDADEVITTQLREELNDLEQLKHDAYLINRENYFLGKKMYPDKVHRLFKRASLHEWTGKVHETPAYSGSTGELSNPLFHYTHTDIASMLEKTNNWSEIEAQLRIDANHPPMKGWRLFRVALTTLFSQLFGKKLWKYGREGWFEAYFQMIDKLIVYTKLWEKQQANK